MDTDHPGVRQREDDDLDSSVTGISNISERLLAEATGHRLDSHNAKATAGKDVFAISCPKKCGWYHCYTNRTEWYTTLVGHPLWGPVTNLAALRLDLLSHDCTEYHNAIIRLRGKQAERKQDEDRS